MIIYEPKGRAAEYAKLAANLYRGCAHGCKYCYAPNVLRMKGRAEFDAAVPRKDALKQLKRDVKKYAGTPYRVLMSFTTDPYQPIEYEHRLTRQAIEIMGEAKIPMNILTKAPLRAIRRDSRLFTQHDIHFGTSITFFSNNSRRQWEPNAETINSRCKALEMAHDEGVSTWVSMEPVIFPTQTLVMIETIASYVDFFKIGKLNHDPAREAEIDWTQFLHSALGKLDDVGASYRIKDELWSHADQYILKHWPQKSGDSGDVVGEKQ